MIENITVTKASTGLTPVAGSADAFALDGFDVPNGIRISNSVSDFRVRPHVTYKNRFSTQSASGQWSKTKRFMTYTVPVLLEDGSTVYNLCRCELEFHPSLTDAEILDLARTGVQFVTDLEAEDFVLKGSLR